MLLEVAIVTDTPCVLCANGGQQVDVRDIYKPKNKDHAVYKWRPAEVRGVDTSGVHVQIHYIGWGEEWDEVINTVREGDRIQPGGTMIIPRGSPRPGQRVRKRAKSPGGGGDVNGGKGNGGGGGGTSGTSSAVRVTTRRRSYGGDTYSATETGQNKVVVSRTVSADAGSGRRRKSAGQIVGHIPSGASVSSTEYEEVDGTFDENAYYAKLKKEADFVAQLNAKGMHVVEVDGDGNCLFRAVAHQIWLDEDRHLELRKMCVEHMEKNAERFVEFCFDDTFAKHLERMGTSGEWGDDLEIKALEEITDRPITIYSSQSPACEPLNTNFDELGHLLQGVKPILLSYHGQNHYNSVFDIHTPLPLEERSSRVILNIRRKSMQT